MDCRRRRLVALRRRRRKGHQSRRDRRSPPAPRGLSVERIGDGEVWFNWQAIEGTDEVLYVVYRSVGDDAAVAIDSTFETRFKDRGLQYELEYTYRVTALNGGGESGPRMPSADSPSTA